MRRVAWTAVCVGGCWLGLGCAEPTATVSKTPDKDALVEIGQMLKTLADEGKKPPTKLAEMEPIEPMMPTASAMIREGNLVYLWGAGYVGSSEKVVAHERKVPAEGGWVLLQNGTVREMTAAEFGAAPKAR